MIENTAIKDLEVYVGTWKTKLPVNNMSLIIKLKDKQLVGQLEAFTPNADHITDAKFTTQEGENGSLHLKWITDDSSGDALIRMERDVLQWKELTPIQDQTNYILPECTLSREVQKHR